MASPFRRLRGGVCVPKGFLASGLHCGLKRARKDLALVWSVRPANAAAIFTRNDVVAHPVRISRRYVKRGVARGVLINSGNANCCTGPAGARDARLIGKEAAALLKVAPEQVLLASTGVIGYRMPVRRVLDKLPLLVRSLDRHGGRRAADAIMTTDTYRKEAAFEVRLSGGRRIRIGGMAKGSGMISPNMATMIAALTTDARVSPIALRAALRKAADRTFNRITVDGEMSTNDCVFLLANGQALGQSLQTSDLDFPAFAEGVFRVCQVLAEDLVFDGEGTSRVFELTVRGAADEKSAERVARQIANSPLVKTMVTGADPNWGRVMAAAGAARVGVSPEKMELFIGRIPVWSYGRSLRPKPRLLRRALSIKRVKMLLDLHQGRATYSLMASDLTLRYVQINASYTS